MTTRRNITKKLAAAVLAWSMAIGMLQLMPPVRAEAAPVSMLGDEIIDVTEQGVTLTVRDEKYILVKELLLKEDWALHDAVGNIYVQMINGDLKVCNYSLQGKTIKPFLLEKNVKEIKTTGEGQEKRLTEYITADGETKNALTIEEARTLLVGIGSTGSNGNNGGTNTGSGNTGTGNTNPGNNGTGNSTNQGSSSTGNGNNNTSSNSNNVSLVGNNGLVYNDGRNQFILSSSKAVDKWLEVGKLVWARFLDGQISNWNMSQASPKEVIVVESGKSGSILLQNGIACYYDTNGVLQVLTTTPATTQTKPTTPSQTSSRISLIGNDAIMYTNGDAQKVLSSGKIVDRHIELGNLLWVRFADGQISFWDLNQSSPSEIIIIEKGKSSSILLQDGKACYYDATGTLQTLTTTPVTAPSNPSTPNQQPTTPTQPTNPTQPSGTGTSAEKITYAYKAKASGVYKYLYNSKNQQVDKRKLAAGILKYSGKKIGNWTNVRWADFNKEGNLIATLKNGTYYSVNHNTLKVEKLGKNAKSRKFQRGLITHIVTKNGAKKNVAHK